MDFDNVLDSYNITWYSDLNPFLPQNIVFRHNLKNQKRAIAILQFLKCCKNNE
jgi:hypothetical protein